MHEQSYRYTIVIPHIKRVLLFVNDVVLDDVEHADHL